MYLVFPGFAGASDISRTSPISPLQWKLILFIPFLLDVSVPVIPYTRHEDFQTSASQITFRRVRVQRLNFTIQSAMKAQRGSIGIVLLFL
jgi:hypothetical protein